MSQSSLASMSLPEKAKLIATDTNFVRVQKPDDSYASLLNLRDHVRVHTLFTVSVMALTLGIVLVNNLPDGIFLVLSIILIVLSAIGALITGIAQFFDLKDLLIAKKYFAQVNAPITPTDWHSSSSNPGRYDRLDSEEIYKRGVRIFQKSHRNVYLATYSPMNILSSAVFIAEELRYDVKDDIYYKNIFHTSWDGLFVQTESFSGPRYSIRQAVKNI